VSDIVSAMPEGTPPAAADDAADREAQAGDARLVRDVRWRLVAWSGGTTLAVLLALGVALYVSVANSLEATGTAQLASRMAILRGFIEHSPSALDGPPTGFLFGGGSSGTFALIVGPDGLPIGRREFEVPEGLPDGAGATGAREKGRDVRSGTVVGVPVRILSERIDSRVGPLVIQVVGDRTAEQRTLDVLLAVLVGGGLVTLLVAAGVGAVYARRALVPIRESLAAQRLAIRRQREFAADASHELRTPLTVIRSSLDHLRRHRTEPVEAVGEALEDIGAEVDHLAALVEDLLLLARSDSGAVALARLPVDLGDVAGDAAASLSKLAADKSVRLLVDPEPAIVNGDQARLRQLVTILVDNAIRHSPDGGGVRVTVRAAGGWASLTVEDEGAGIRPEDMPRIFDRFWRAPGSPAGGTGLGLAIASWIVRGHHGRIDVANRPEGGARFTVRLPTHPPAESG
jgi:signal transduction histidine kinase